MTNKVTISTENIDISKLRSKLKHGDIKKVISRSGKSPNHVYKVLNPNNERIDDDVIKAALEILNERGFVEVDSRLANMIIKQAG